MGYKKPEYDIHKSHLVFVETGLIIALGLLIALTKLPMPEHEPEIILSEIQDAAPLILPPATKNEPFLIPPPPIPEVPVIIPDDAPIEPPELEFSEFDMITVLEVPPMEKEIEIEVDFDLLAEVEVLPELIGGEKALRDQINYPLFARQNRVEGIVEVEFFVNTKGEVVNPKIVKGIGAGCDRAVLKAIKKQKYKPGVKNGEISEFKIKETVQFILIDL